ncbi:NHL repeat-containing protein [Actinomadura napierensis]|uniref:WD40 repeat domain-containing protein n=1 Tax=Actinomadura napierensis TaxID=267854 RepID=A0ABN2Y6L8_9ACTN
MKTLPEDLVREALADAAATVTPGSLRPLTVGAPRRRRRPVLFAVAAATAMALAIAALVIRPSDHATEAPRMTLAAYAGAKYVLIGALPPGRPVSVTEAATGREIARIPAPRGAAGFWDAAGTGDGRTFFLTTVDVGRSLIHLYRLYLNTDGTPRTLTELPQLALHGLPGEGPRLLAATRDKSRIAYVTESGAKLTIGKNGGYSLTDDEHIRERITVLDVATGRRRAVDLPEGQIADQLTWTLDGRRLLFTAETRGGGLRVLDAATGEIRPVPLGPAGTELIGAATDADSGHIVALVAGRGQGHARWYSLATGKIDRDVPLGEVRPGSPTVVAFGDTIVAEIGDHLYKIANGTVHKQPIPPGVVDLSPQGAW